MKRVLLVVCLILTPFIVSAAPFLVCDSYQTGIIPDYFKVSLDGGTEVTSPIWSGTAGGTTFTNAVHFDLASVTVGNHTASVKACKSGDATWGTSEVCSTASPLSFSRPAPGVAPSAPTGMQLVR